MDQSPGSDLLNEVAPLVRAGVAVHWLRPRSKAPVDDGWSTAPVATIERLRASYAPGLNGGVRLGEPSKLGDLYLHLIDVDIRDTAQAADAWAELDRLLPGARDLPFVVSGSGGESRHVYLLCETAFPSKKLARSAGFKMVFDPAKGREVKRRDWEIELFGTGKQAVLPPSIHPDTGRPYRWGRPLDLELIELGLGPVISAERLAGMGVRLEAPSDEDLVGLTRQNPLGLEEPEIRRILADLPLDDWCEDRDGWLQVGMALHHEHAGAESGYALWCEFSRQSAKFNEKEQRQVWKSFKGRPVSVRMATLVKAAAIARLERQFDDEPESNTLPSPMPAAEADDFDDLLDGADDPLDEIISEVADVDTLWRRKLDLTEDGIIKPTLHNVRLIVAHDPRTRGLPQLNEFLGEVVQRQSPGQLAKARRASKEVKQLAGPIWRVRNRGNGDQWNDARDNAIRDLFEAPKTQGGYGLKITDRDLKAAVDMVARDNGFHPVREYLTGLKWDGQARLDTFFVRHLGAPDNAYSREIARLFMLGAVARAFEPGHKFDFVPILEGLQGKRKSTFIKILARDWSAELQGDFHDRKAMVEKMQGAWILEIPELSGFSKAEVQEIKAFVSAESDKVRLAYARRGDSYLRQCVFAGSTNEGRYLRDSTGARRFWPVHCTVAEIDTAAVEREIDQVWAEAFAAYQTLRTAQPHGTLPLFLRDEALAEAQRIQESRRVETSEDAMAGKIGAWLDGPIRDEHGFDDEGAGGRPMQRNETCLLEIWVECLRRDPAHYDTRASQELGRSLAKLTDWETADRSAPSYRYGRQRMYRRLGTNGHPSPIRTDFDELL